METDKMISWISQSRLNEQIDILLQRASSAKSEARVRMEKNVTDPFSSLVTASTFNVSNANSLLKMKSFEAVVRGISNALGEFHQSVLGSVSGWENHDSGYDLECPDRRIIAEVKNKWNTMNASNRRQIETDLNTGIRQKRGDWKAYLVLILPKTPIRQRKEKQKNLYEIDGASFYELVTGDANAIHDLFDHMLRRICNNDSVAEYCQTVLENSLPPRLG